MSFNASNVTQSSASGNNGTLTAITVLAALGIVLNVFAFSYVVYSPKIRRPLKVTLFNLVGSDCIFVTGVLVSTILAKNTSAFITACPVLTVMLLVPSPISYSAVLGLAVYNFIAVYKATQFTELITTQKTIICSVVAWTVILLTYILALALGRKKGPYCSLLTQAPPFVLVFFAVYCMACSFTMAALNISVAVKLRSTRIIGFTDSKVRRVQNAGPAETFYKEDSSQLPKLLSVPKPAFKRSLTGETVFKRHIAGEKIFSESKLSELDASKLGSEYSNERMEFCSGHNIDCSCENAQSNLLNTTTTPKSSSSLVTGELTVPCVNNFPDGMSHEEDRMHLFSRKSIAGIDSSLPQTFLNSSAGHIHGNTSSNSQSSCVNEDNSQSSIRFRLPLDTMVKVPSLIDKKGAECLLSTLKTSNTNNDSVNGAKTRCQISSKNPQDLKGNSTRVPSLPRRMRSTIFTLTILAVWNATLAFPILGMWVWLATEKNAIAADSFIWVANALPILATFNSVANPVLYAWRFVDWRRLCVMLCKNYNPSSFKMGNMAGDSKHTSHIG